jgi:hypothetical protein
MGRSLSRPAPTNIIEDKRNPEFLHSLSDTHYSTIARAGEYYQRRWQLGFDGKETNVEELKIDYVIGSGEHARSYLHRMANGAFIELPLGWYSEKGGYWGMSPGPHRIFFSLSGPSWPSASYTREAFHARGVRLPL